ncbi:MAG: hypothetical protein PHD81_01210 [Candidatus Nanoarchaeia archaeon]|nr:hypothetical protein [Candidatus Nanoarchaeia archaeon]MDD5587709.1 hypothetical protein [Candidatus Nanoarchaeia archaeon]
MQLDYKKIREYYSRKDVKDELLKIAQNREVQAWFSDVRGKRPDTINFPGDIDDLVKKGMTSFHISEERWHDPLQLKPGMNKRELDENRSGWDLLLDIDCKDVEISRITAELLLEALIFHDVKDISLKFSGNHGFHIGIPYESFPEQLNGKQTRLLFPELVRIVANYLKEMIKPFLTERILKIYSLDKLSLKFTKHMKDLVKEGKFDPYSIVDIDSVLISSRHMFRAPYSINEKSNLVSIPLNPTKEALRTFKLEDAKIENVKVKLIFLDMENVTKESARNLLLQSYDWNMKNQKADVKILEKKTYENSTDEILEEDFPPCIKLLLKGLKEDGRKRAVFILINFLRHCNWPLDKIEKTLNEWNKKNYEPLREGYAKSQLEWSKKQSNIILPANCDNPAYYKSMAICVPDGLCKMIKNPVNYAIRKSRMRKDSKKNKK